MQHRWVAKHQYFVDGKGKKRKVEPVRHVCSICGAEVVGVPPKHDECPGPKDE